MREYRIKDYLCASLIALLSLVFCGVLYAQDGEDVLMVEEGLAMDEALEGDSLDADLDDISLDDLDGLGLDAEPAPAPAPVPKAATNEAVDLAVEGDLDAEPADLDDLSLDAEPVADDLDDLTLDDDPIDEPVAEPAADLDDLTLDDEPAAEPVAEPVADDLDDLTLDDDPLAEPVAEPAADLDDLTLDDEPASEPVAEPVADDLDDLTLDDDPIDEPVAEPAADLDDLTLDDEPVAEPVAEPAADDVDDLMLDDDPLAEPVAEPAADDLDDLTLDDEPAAEPVAEPVADDLDDLTLDDDPLAEPVAEPVADDLDDLTLDDDPMADPGDDLDDLTLDDDPAADGVDDLTLDDDPAADGVDDLTLDDDPMADPVDDPAAVVEDSTDIEALASEPLNVEAAFNEARLEDDDKPPVSFRDKEVVDMQSRAILERRAYEYHAIEQLEEGEKNVQSTRYEESLGRFEECLKFIGTRKQNEVYRQRARTGMSIAYYKLAEKLADEKNWEEAGDMIKRAKGLGYPNAADLAQRIEDEAVPPPAVIPEPPPRIVSKEFQDLTKDISKRLRLGRQYMQTGEYETALLHIESVMKKDPENTEAIRLMRKIHQIRLDRSKLELQSTRDKMIRDVVAAWNPRNYALELRETKYQPEAGNQGHTDKVRLEIIEKMKSIIIPELEFRQANIQDVIAFLQQASIDYDIKTEDTSKKGVNLIIHITDKSAGDGADEEAEAAPSDDPFATMTDDAGEDGEAASGNHFITFNARSISLMEALTIITEIAELKIRIEGSVVMIVDKNAPIGDIVVRWYDVMGTFAERVSNVSPEITAPRGAGGDGGFIAIESEGVEAGEAADWMRLFEEMGVQWPEGSKIRHVPSLGKLIVANTAENLVSFEKILQILNVVPTQIEIETRFVEVTQTDLSSLGFEWGLAEDWVVAQEAGSAGLPLAERPRVTMAANNANGGFTTGNRFVSDVPSVGDVGDSILALTGTLTDPDLTFILHALDQKSSTDMLSAPKITTQAGVEATIKVVTEYIYPTEFTVNPIQGQNENGSTTMTGGIVEPSSFETREVGVILSVLPEVSAAGQMINLVMTPEVVTDPEWKNYGTTYTDESGNEVSMAMEQPFFHTRTLSTTLSIYNGATVVMGGMITEARSTVEDRIPLLGDLPIIGRLFRSEFENSEKRNLLVFVTARLVDPAGRAVKRADNIDVETKKKMEKEQIGSSTE